MEMPRKEGDASRPFEAVRLPAVGKGRSGAAVDFLPDDRWFPLAVARTKITMRWLSSLSVLGVGLAIWLERSASFGLAAFALLLGLVGLALHQSVARAGA
jgi:hypothetical protein